jgi:hypothetical protein
MGFRCAKCHHRHAGDEPPRACAVCRSEIGFEREVAASAPVRWFGMLVAAAILGSVLSTAIALAAS